MRTYFGIESMMYDFRQRGDIILCLSRITECNWYLEVRWGQATCQSWCYAHLFQQQQKKERSDSAKGRQLKGDVRSAQALPITPYSTQDCQINLRSILRGYGMHSSELWPLSFQHTCIQHVQSYPGEPHPNESRYQALACFANLLYACGESTSP
jgi:hypothetical protein